MLVLLKDISFYNYHSFNFCVKVGLVNLRYFSESVTNICPAGFTAKNVEVSRLIHVLRAYYNCDRSTGNFPR